MRARRCVTASLDTVVDHAVAARQIRPGELTLGTDSGTALTARAFRARLAEHGIVHRRDGYRDPESQAFIASWFSKLKERCGWPASRGCAAAGRGRSTASPPTPRTSPTSSPRG